MRMRILICSVAYMVFGVLLFAPSITNPSYFKVWIGVIFMSGQILMWGVLFFNLISLLFEK